MLKRPLKVFLFLSFVMLMGQQSCQTTPSGGGQTSGVSSSGGGLRLGGSGGGSVPGDPGPNGSVSCGSPQSSFQCLICNCHLETGVESPAGKLAVGKVVMTRVGMSSYPNSVCGVIYQRSQFSWTLSRKTRNSTVSGGAYRQCYDVMKKAYQFRGHYASHYHADYVWPAWRRRCKGKFVIGTHIFYKDCGGQQRAPEGKGSSSVASLLERGNNENNICTL